MELLRGVGELVKASGHLKGLLEVVLEEGLGRDWVGAGGLRGWPVWMVGIGRVVENRQLWRVGVKL